MALALIVTPLGPELIVSSFQSRFYYKSDDRTRVIKIYQPKNVYPGVLDLSNSSIRDEVIQRELDCVGILASEASPTGTHSIEQGRLLRGIEVDYIQQGNFLETILNRGESVSNSVYRNIAEKVASFHFNEKVCPSSQVESMTSYLYRLMAIETKLLMDWYPHISSKAIKWFKTMQGYLRLHSETLEEFRYLTGEPIKAHGDIEPVNVAINNEGNSLILDSAPVPLWRHNLMIMDVEFLGVDLLIRGLDRSREALMSAYNQAYYRNLKHKGLGQQSLSEVEKARDILDEITKIYRLTNFLRLSQPGLRNQPEKISICESLLDEAYTRISQ